MKYCFIIKEQATQNLWQLANYILVNGNAQTTVKFLNSPELTFRNYRKIKIEGVKLEIDLAAKKVLAA